MEPPEEQAADDKVGERAVDDLLAVLGFARDVLMGSPSVEEVHVQPSEASPP
jgi:hypothetical protein